MRYGKGFSLIEMVIVIVVLGLVAVAIGPILTRPFSAYEDLSRRTALVDAAQSALSQIANEVRDAIPNSLRTNGSTAVEMMPIRGGGRYRFDPVAANNSGLAPSAPDASFQILGNLDALPAAARLVVYNTGAGQLYAAATSGTGGIISPASTTISLTDNGNEDQLTLSAPYQFDISGTGSPAKRFYLANQPVSYVCDLASGQLRRYEGYAIALVQPTNPGAPPLSSAPAQAVVAEYVTACNFDYQPGSNSRTGLLIMTLSLSLEGESIQLLNQVHVGNAP